MRLFKGFDDDNGEATIQEAVGAVVREAAELNLWSSAQPWSLAEVWPDDGDFTWLFGWAEQLEVNTVRKCFARQWKRLKVEYCPVDIDWAPRVDPQTGWTRLKVEGCLLTWGSALGTLLLLLASEAVRREAPMTALWPAVRRGRDRQPRFQRSTERELFRDGQPSELFKEMIETAVEDLNLRHVLGLEDTFRYAGTVLLQCGVTYPSLAERLPDWLDGSAPVTVERLRAGPLSSRSFAKLWDALRAYRVGSQDATKVRPLLEDSPWVLSEWADELLAWAKAPGAVGPLPPPAEPEAASFLQTPRLRWEPPAAPRFVCAFADLHQLDLSEELYQVVIGGRRQTLLRRQADGTYLPSAAEVVLPFTAPQIVVNLLTARAEPVHSQILSLWDPAELVTVYRESSGWPLPPGEQDMETKQGYVLLFAPDLGVAPAPSYWERLEENGAPVATLCRLGSGWAAETEVRSGEVVVWRPRVGAEPPGPAVPRWAEDVRLSLAGAPDGQVYLGQPFRMLIHHLPDVAVTFARSRTRTLGLNPVNARSTMTERLTLPPPLARLPLRIVLGLRRGDNRARVTRTLDALRVCGAARLEGSDWTVLNENQELTVQQAQQQPFVVLPAVSQKYPWERWVLMEGNRWVGGVRRVNRPLGTLAGLGAPLTACVGPWIREGETLGLSKEVVDRGLLRNVIHEMAEPRRPRLELAADLDPDAQHRIVWWDAEGRLHRDLVPLLLQDAAEPRPNWWSVNAAADLGEPLAVALAYEGDRLGCWWQCDWADSLKKLGSHEPRSVGRLLRWLRLPLLAKGSVKQVRGFFRDHPAESLMAWVFDPPPEGLRWPASEVGWRYAVAELARDWTPAAKHLARLCDLLDVVAEGASPIYPLVLQLIHIDPLLMGRLLRVWLQDMGNKEDRQRLLHVLAADIAQENPGGGAAVFQACRERLLQASAQTMQVAHEFISELLGYGCKVLGGGQPEPVLDASLAVATSGVESFRRLLALDLLRSM